MSPDVAMAPGTAAGPDAAPAGTPPRAQWLAMPDGTRLHTLVHLPQGEPHSVVLLRTCYGVDAHRAEAAGWTAHGHAFVVQDVRGRHGSEGSFHPYRHELDDARAVLAWLAAQPWCRRVVAMGGSYAAHTAWCSALAARELGVECAVVSSVPALGARQVARGTWGIPNLLAHTLWWAGHAGRRIGDEEKVLAALDADPGLLEALPATELARRLAAGTGDELPDWLATLTDPPAGPLAEHLPGPDVPALHVGGWYDAYTATLLDLAERPGLTSGQSLLLGAWTHELRTHQDTLVGDRTVTGGRLALGSFVSEWIRAVAENPAHREVHVFLPGECRWLDEAEWRGRTRRRIALADPGQAPAGFVHNPADPFPSLSAPCPQPLLDERTDLLRRDLPLAARLAGTPRARLRVRLDAPSADVVLRLSELDEHGDARYLSHGIAEVDPRTADADGWCEVEFDLRPCAATVQRLRVEVTGSYFPEHLRNPQTGVDRLLATTTRPCHYLVDMAGSWLDLPVLEGSSR